MSLDESAGTQSETVATRSRSAQGKAGNPKAIQHNYSTVQMVTTIAANSSQLQRNSPNLAE